MLEIIIPETELFNESTNEFIEIKKPIKLQLEHSLISIKKWESSWHKPFLGKEEKTAEEWADYIRCMTIGTPLELIFYSIIPDSEFLKIVEYIKDPMTATWFNEENIKSLTGSSKDKNKVITNEIIYYWMITLGIPMEYQRWHLNQLLTLIKVINLENTPKKKMDRNTEMQRRHKLNMSRINASKNRRH